MDFLFGSTGSTGSTDTKEQAASDEGGIFSYLNKWTLKFYDDNHQNEWVIKEIDSKRVYAAISFLIQLAGAIAHTLNYEKLRWYYAFDSFLKIEVAAVVTKFVLWFVIYVYLRYDQTADSINGISNQEEE